MCVLQALPVYCFLLSPSTHSLHVSTRAGHLQVNIFFSPKEGLRATLSPSLVLISTVAPESLAKEFLLLLPVVPRKFWNSASTRPCLILSKCFKFITECSS
jgi:hypothetical protein